MNLYEINKYRSQCSIYSDYMPIRREDVPQEVLDFVAQAEAEELEKKNLKNLKDLNINKNLVAELDSLDSMNIGSINALNDALNLINDGQINNFLISKDKNFKITKNETDVVCASLLDDCENVAENLSPPEIF
ncbi:unnamed protein product [Oikopleura dioica]|uniref:Uncharacterized protein n=1 Tax=Oikopleura dioica TaxID=34765 RepID=E4XXV3_OIKDI|nr:unnamed protein product [Oikopleura dioica]